MQWLSGFSGFRVRTLLVSILVVYLLLKREKLSSVEKQGVWATALIFFAARIPLEVIAYLTGLWSYNVTTFAVFGVPIDVLAAMAVFFGSGSALVQHYLQPRGKRQAVLALLGLAVFAVIYDLGGSAMYGYLTIKPGGFWFKLTSFIILTLLSGIFFAWFVRRYCADVVVDKEV